MEKDAVARAIESLEKANANLEPELLAAKDARELMDLYVRAQRLVSYGIAALARKVNDPQEVARATGTSVGKARDTVRTGEVLRDSEDLSLAMQAGAVSLEQAAEIANAVTSAPDAAGDLLKTAKEESFHVLKERARKAKLEAEQHRGLAERQRAARCGRTYADELGMIHFHFSLEPHVGTPLAARVEAEAQRLYRAAKKKGDPEPFERYVADACAKGLPGGSLKGPAKRPELVVLVSHQVAKRGWGDVQPGEVCKIPGVGPVAPEVAKEIAGDAFLSGVFYDGQDLRHLKRWTRSIPAEVALALELGDAPGFEGIACTDCGKRFRTEFDHVEPHACRGPTSRGNLKPRCYPCHRAKTERDRHAGKLNPPDP